MERLTHIRQQPSPHPEWLRYPFLYLSEYPHLPRPMVGEPHEDREIQDFPDCVTHYYWIHEGTKDEDAWRALFQYEDKNTGTKRYGFYLGECDYTGFDCQGTMDIYVADRYDVLIERAMGDRDYSLYLKETEEH